MRYVLVTSRLDVVPERGELCNVLDSRWIRFLREAALIAIPCPAFTRIEDLADIFGLLSGIVLTGGNDLSRHSPELANIERDRLERELLIEARQRRLPVIGVCRGLLLLADVAGAEIARVSGHVRSHHILTVRGSRLLAAHNGQQVNSYHRYAPVGEIPGYAITGTSEDGGVEAIEAERAVGIMWHPERADRFSPADIRLFSKVFS